MTNAERTLTISCPRCGIALEAQIYRCDVRVRTIDVGNFTTGRTAYVDGLEAEAVAAVSHSC